MAIKISLKNSQWLLRRYRLLFFDEIILIINSYGKYDCNINTNNKENIPSTK